MIEKKIQTKSIVSYVFNDNELLSLIDINNINNTWSNEWIQENNTKYSVIAKSLANHLLLEYHFLDNSEEKCHFIGYSIENKLDTNVACETIEIKSSLLMKLFKTKTRPKLYFL